MRAELRTGESNLYAQLSMNSYEREDERYFQESSEQKLKMFREVLDEKMNEVFKKIKHSQNALDVEKEIEFFRKKIHTSNFQYDEPRDNRPMDEEYSHFYKIPKKETVDIYKSKNLNYESQSMIRKES